MKTHRCPESLKQRTPIRYDSPPWSDEKDWYLYEYWSDWDWNTEGISVVCKIKFCPFCGEELK